MYNGLIQRVAIPFAFLVGFAATASAQAVSGSVTCNGKGVANVVVTDGKYFAQTDSKGRYALPDNDDAQWVYLSVPSGYSAPADGSITRFYQPITRGAKRKYAFELSQTPGGDSKHRFLHFSDIQIKQQKEADQLVNFVADAQQTIAATPKGTSVFGVDCGDIVGDNHAMYEQYLKHVNELRIPVARAIGNHDMDYWGGTHESSYRTFEKLFGPTVYSFNRGEAHYIIVNDVYFVGRDYFYIGNLTDKTLRWIEKDLAFVKKGSPVFVAMHIPSTLTEGTAPFEYSFKIAETASNAKALHQLLKPFNAHILSGHTHYNKNMVLSDSLYEHNVGATSGAWWQGDACTDGTPMGYGVYDVNGTTVTWSFKTIGKPQSYQFRAYPVGYTPDQPGCIVANVWNWDKSWKVEWYEDGVLRGEMERYDGKDPYVNEIYSDKSKLEYKWIYPSVTNHLFRAKPTKEGATVEVVATDRFGNVYRQTVGKR